MGHVLFSLSPWLIPACGLLRCAELLRPKRTDTTPTSMLQLLQGALPTAPRQHIAEDVEE